MAKSERVKRLCYVVCLFFFILFVSRKLNQVAFMLAFHRVELYTLLIMVQWIIPMTVFILWKREGGRIVDLGFVKGGVCQANNMGAIGRGIFNKHSLYYPRLDIG